MKSYMDIDRTILMKHLSNAYLENLHKQYQSQGYATYQNYKLSEGLIVDFAAVKEDRRILVEIKSTALSDTKRDSIVAMRNYIAHAQPATELKLAFLNPPGEKEISFENIELLLFNDISSHGVPDQLDQLSSHTYLDEVVDVDVDSIDIDPERIKLKGTATVGVILGQGSESEDDNRLYDSFPFTFKITISHEMAVEDAVYDFDTSSYYE